MDKIKKLLPGMLVCLAIALPSWYLGRMFPVVGGAVIAILSGMVIATFWSNRGAADAGIKFTSKMILQSAVVFLGFGLNLAVVLKTGLNSLPIIVSTIATALIIAYVLHKLLKVSSNISVLVGVGSSICGGSAIAATAPVIGAKDEEIAQSISVIFFFNVLAAILFPILGQSLVGSSFEFSTVSGDAFGLFAGTAINDTSSVTAAAATWDSMWGLGHETLDTAVTVKLTRTLAIIPITMVLAFYCAQKRQALGEGFSLKRALPMFIIYFILASLVTTILVAAGVEESAFAPCKELAKFLIVMAMAAIGLGTNLIKLVKSGGKPIVIGAACWAGITAVSMLMMHSV